MHAYSRTAIDFAGRTWGPGVFACSDAEYHALALRGPCRPATADEAAKAAASPGPPPLPEAAALAPGGEQAVARRAAPARQRCAGPLKIPA